MRGETEMESTLGQIHQAQNKIEKHVERMPDGKRPKEATNYKSRGRQNVGRPMQGWKQTETLKMEQA